MAPSVSSRVIFTSFLFVSGSSARWVGHSLTPPPPSLLPGNRMSELCPALSSSSLSHPIPQIQGDTGRWRPGSASPRGLSRPLPPGEDESPWVYLLSRARAEAEFAFLGKPQSPAFLFPGILGGLVCMCRVVLTVTPSQACTGHGPVPRVHQPLGLGFSK